MVLFSAVGKENTEAAARLALDKAKELDTDLVLSSNTGYTAEIVLSLAEELAFTGRVIVVRSASKAADQGVNRMTPETVQALEQRGAVIVTCAHALSAGERGFTAKFQGAYPLDIMANTLRTFGQGTKVCFEVAVMALDTGNLAFGKPVVAMGGSARGADTALVITPSYSSTILQTRIHEILCKPDLLQSPAKEG